MQHDSSISKFYSNGKLLLTAEYFVLDGALALALPTKPGQSLQISENQSDKIEWKSFDADGNAWFEGTFDLPSGECLTCNDIEIGSRLTQVLAAIQKQNPSFLKKIKGLYIETRLDFPRLWGLGTSSTLIANLAQWAGINPYQLLQDTFGGSGYDIACAQASGPILYQLKNGQPISKSISFKPGFYQNLYFVYLGKKQDSRAGIAHYRNKVQQQPALVSQISNLTLEFLESKKLADFEGLIHKHEAIVAETLELPPAKALYFQDFWGEIKSLGAWGGDFVLVTSDRSAEETKFYFNIKGFSVVLPFEKLVL